MVESMSSMGRLQGALAGLVLAGCVAGCVAYGPGDLRRGDAESDVVRSMGAPSARYALGDGSTRLAYARGPFGRHTWMVDLGADGRVVGWEQVLGEASFAQLASGITADELLRSLGPPAQRRPAGLVGGEVWSYRYPTNDCLWFQVTLGDDHRVRGGSYGTDPGCDVGDRVPGP